MCSEFELDEVVWAKVSGFPWWPGFIASKVEDQLYEVIFLSDLSRAFLTKSKIKKYVDIQMHQSKASKQL